MEQTNMMKVEWFDINEQQPPIYTQVLFKCKGSELMEVGMYLGEEFVKIMKASAAPHPILNKSRKIYGKHGRYCTPAEHDTVVTHWMVLPEPPNEEEQGETKC